MPDRSKNLERLRAYVKNVSETQYSVASAAGSSVHETLLDQTLLDLSTKTNQEKAVIERVSFDGSFVESWLMCLPS